MITSSDLKPFFENYNEWTVRKLLKIYSYEQIYESTKHLLSIKKDKDINERIYLILNKIKEIPTCKYCGNPVTFWSIPKGYHNYCSYSCSNFITSIDRVKLIREKYGDKAFNYSESWYKKSEEEKLEVLRGREKTNLEKFEYKSYMSTPEFRQSITDAAQEQYGVDHFTQAPEIQLATKQTCLDVYGYENQMQSPIIQQQAKDTCLERYGYEYASQNPEIWKKGLVTFKNNYGFNSNFCRLEVQEKAILKKIERYGTPNPSVGFSKISQEFCWKLYNILPKELQKHTHFATLNSESWIRYKGNNKNKYVFLDMCIYSLKIAIEFHGDYWHKNPQTHEYNLENLSVWLQDEFKKEIIENNGYTLFTLWESTYREDPEKEVNKLLKQILLINNKIDINKEV